jgi:predicted signal transduction protein with EAL and GGDEF domain
MGDQMTCTASIGVATTVEGTTGQATTEEELLRHADLALDAAKAAGRACLRTYEPSMVEAVTFRKELRSALCPSHGTSPWWSSTNLSWP